MATQPLGHSTTIPDWLRQPTPDSALRTPHSAEERAWWQFEEGWLSLLLLLLVVLSAAWAVQAAGWVDRWTALQLVVLLGVFAGFGLAKSRISGFVVFPYGWMLGVLVVLWQITSYLDSGTVLQRVLQVVSRTNAWAYAFRTGSASNDNLVFVFAITGGAWAIGYLAGWFVYRLRRPFLGVVPAGIGLLATLVYSPAENSWYFALFLLAALLLIMRLQLAARERVWRRDQLEIATSLGRHFFRDAVAFALVVVVFAWTVPAARASSAFQETWNQFTGPWQDFQSEMNRMFASLNGQRSPVVGGGSPYGGRTMPLRGAIKLGDRLALTVYSEEGHYWHGVSYDEYTGRGWVAKEKVVQPVTAGVPLAESSEFQERKIITQKVRVELSKTNIIYAAGQPLALNQTASAEFDPPTLVAVTLDVSDPAQDENLPPEFRDAVKRVRDRLAALPVPPGAQQRSPGQRARLLDSLRNASADVRVDDFRFNGLDLASLTLTRVKPLPSEVTGLRVTNALKQGQEYEVTSAVSTATEKQLREAGTAYPPAVTQRYLQLPPSLPPRVAELAQQITAGADNPYDKATLIERYLRKFKYNENIAPPPPEGDLVDHFLFVSKEGYCDYYASSMVVLLRTLGIPARITTGYNTGEYDAEKAAFLVRGLNSHSWPEVYFPRYGWIDFEPTPSQPLVARADGISVPDSVETPVRPSTYSGSLEGDPFFLDELPFGDVGGAYTIGRAAQPALPVLAFLPPAALLLFAAAGVYTLRRGLSGMAPVTQTYEKMSRFAALAGVARRPSQTPHEYADTLGRAVPLAREPVETITEAYTAAVFGRRELAHAERVAVDSAWKRLRNLLIRRSWRGFHSFVNTRTLKESIRDWAWFLRHVLSGWRRRRSAG